MTEQKINTLENITSIYVDKNGEISFSVNGGYPSVMSLQRNQTASIALSDRGISLSFSAVTEDTASSTGDGVPVDGGPAFPFPYHPKQEWENPRGMSIRDYFAAMAIQTVIEKLNFKGLLTEDCAGDFLRYSKTAYKIADAMLAAREVNA